MSAGEGLQARTELVQALAHLQHALAELATVVGETVSDETRRQARRRLHLANLRTTVSVARAASALGVDAPTLVELAQAADADLVRTEGAPAAPGS